jgi:hypothetical protein
MEDTLPDFTNKVVYVFFDSGLPTNRLAVENPNFQLQGGKLFLVGRGLMSRSWGSDVPTAIAWSKIQWYTIFDSTEAFLEAESFYKKNRKRGFWSSKG